MRFIKRLMEIKEWQTREERCQTLLLRQILEELKGRSKDGKKNNTKVCRRRAH